MTAAPATLARAIRDLEYDCQTFIADLEAEVESMASLLREEADLETLASFRELRERLAAMVAEHSAMNREEMEADLAANRKYDLGDDDKPAEAAVDPVEPYGMCEPCEI